MGLGLGSLFYRGLVVITNAILGAPYYSYSISWAPKPYFNYTGLYTKGLNAQGFVWGFGDQSLHGSMGFGVLCIVLWHLCGFRVQDVWVVSRFSEPMGL